VSALKICPTCGVTYPETELFCPKDGMALHWQGAASTNLIGSILAERYHVLKQLGAGGMGRVYLAEHVKMGRPSAIKVLHPAMAGDAEAIGRFNREAANASRIDHPNVAAIYDFGETHDGLLYLAMQYVEGETLTEILKRDGALHPLRASDITRQAAEGLHAAHALGIVHRDFKPDNVMVSTDAAGIDTVKVVDFGIAKASREHGQGVTRTGMVIGTPEYMSPEQLAGETVDARSDQYALALVAFNMLTGDLPFPAASTGSLAVMRLTQLPRTLADVRPDVSWPNELQTVIGKGLDRDPSLRYSSTRDFAYALHAAIVTMPSHALTRSRTRPMETAPSAAVTTVVTPPSRSGTTGPSTPRRRRIAPLIGVAVALLLLVTALAAARGPVRRIRANAAVKEGISAFKAGHRDLARARFAAAITASPNDPLPHVYLSRLARETNDLAAAKEEGIAAVRLAPTNGTALRELATTLFAMQNFSAARLFYVRAITADPGDHTSEGYLGCTLIQLGRTEEGLRWIQRAGSGTWSTCAVTR
jgi:eukaryotic-like serine/threonine-protein kinase